jgi:small subunit ribosomal protein S2
MKGLPDAIFVVDTNQESIAVDEAKVLNIPVIAIVDTNSNPKLIDYPIPANDDSIRAVKLIVSEISKAICESKSMAYPDGEVSIEQAVPEDDDKISNSTDIDDKSDTTGTDGKQIEELVVDSTEED